MKKFSIELNRTNSCWAAVAFYAVCGLLLLILPNLALSIANFALAGMLCVIGFGCIFTYARGSALVGAQGISLAVGLASLCFGVLLCFSPNFLRALLPFLWGLSLLIGGFGKVQMSIDLKRIGERLWWVVLIAATVSFTLGVFAITTPAFLATVFTQFIGISLLAEAVIDLISFLAINKKVRKYRKTMGAKT